MERQVVVMHEYTLKNVTLRLNKKGEVTVVGDDRITKEELPVRDITLTEKGFSFTVNAGDRQYYIPFENMDSKKIIVPIDMRLKAVPDNAACPALFLYDMLAEYIGGKRGFRIFDLESIKERHKAFSSCWDGIDLEKALQEIKF